MAENNQKTAERVFLCLAIYLSKGLIKVVKVKSAIPALSLCKGVKNIQTTNQAPWQFSANLGLHSAPDLASVDAGLYLEISELFDCPSMHCNAL